MLLCDNMKIIKLLVGSSVKRDDEMILNDSTSSHSFIK